MVLLCMFVLLNTGLATNEVKGSPFSTWQNNFIYANAETLTGDNLVLWSNKALETLTYSITACSLSNLRTQSVIPLGKCACSKCRANQYCCPSANGLLQLFSHALPTIPRPDP